MAPLAEKTGPKAVLLFVLLLVLGAAVPTIGKGFLSDVDHARLDAAAFQQELSEAMGMVLGCGGQVELEELEAIEQVLKPIWQSLHKISQGRIERRSLRYLVHRYFDRRSALHIRGFEPSRPVNASGGWGDADILSQRVPAYVESVLESKHRSIVGFDLRDAAYMVATIQHLVYDSESAILETVYRQLRKPLTRSLSDLELQEVLQSYMLHWLSGDDETARILLKNQSLAQEAIPHWDKIRSMAHGRVQALRYKRQHDPRLALADGSARFKHNALSPRYSYKDAHEVAAGITTSFASFWESECQAIKDALVVLDTHHTGRVPLSKFYSSSLDGEWRFGESESYLRELGALDETGWRGKQVIIPNYIQGASNCIVSTSHYLVCCVNECETLMGELEVAIGSELAQPGQVLELIRNMSSQASLDDDFPAELTSSLAEQLEKIASTNGGAVPLHGRLFAQWLHYAFPRECPFPHKVGAVTALSPNEYGDAYLAQEKDMERHALEANASEIPADVGREQLHWMSQWSAEEELVSDEAMRKLRSPWKGWSIVAGGAATLVAGLCRLVGARGSKASIGRRNFWGVDEKSHFV